MQQEKSGMPSLQIFHPLISRWFSRTLGAPTEIQQIAWPVIAEGKHVLVTAETGTGKTLAAFLYALNQLISQNIPAGTTRVLYLSPLKALNNDVQKNLISPLNELSRTFQKAGATFPDIRVRTRSGDTPPDERRKMAKNPPEILITTPESLNILLTSHSGRRTLTGIRTLILDEIHAVAGTKRGVHMISAVERLTLLSGEFQRIGLSATVSSMETIAQFMGGYRYISETRHYAGRNVEIISAKKRKLLHLSVVWPKPVEPLDRNSKDDSAGRWPAIVRECVKVIGKNHSTLFFANSRRTTEKITRLINEEIPGHPAYAHHGALSKEIRLAVEQKLKNRELKAIVATNSLELGIDIGDLEQVVMIQTPKTVSSAVQRIGRSGHRVGETAKGIIIPTHGKDLVDALVISQMVKNRDIEEIRPVEAPLDMLAQIILSMTIPEKWDIDRLYDFLRCISAYHALGRKHFDLVLEMLGGRFAGTRLRELGPKVIIDKIDNTIEARSQAARLVYMNGGSIPDRGYFHLRLEGNASSPDKAESQPGVENAKTRIGELDEEFVWERRAGESFALGTQTWKIRRITENEVIVTPGKGSSGYIPFWRGEFMNREFHYSEKIAEFLEKAEGFMDDPHFFRELVDEYSLTENAAHTLIRYLKLQKSATRAPLPHRHHLLIEHCRDTQSKRDAKQVILHTLWGSRINRPFGLALSGIWEETYGYPLEIFIDDDAIMLILPHDFSADALFEMVSRDSLEDNLQLRLAKTGFFGARFRENAARALLLPKADFKKRMPLWLTRLRAKKLMEAVSGDPEFPVFLETWRECIKDEFDLANTRILLQEIADGGIRVGETVTSMPSPFAANLVWQETNTYMYMDDTPVKGKPAYDTGSLVREVAFSDSLRPRFSESLIQALEARLKRTEKGYAPNTPKEMILWVKQRILIPETEWKVLLENGLDASGKDHQAFLFVLSKKLIHIQMKGAKEPFICALENLHSIFPAFGFSMEQAEIRPLFQDHPLPEIPEPGNQDAAHTEDPLHETNIFHQWISFSGPCDPLSIQKLFGWNKEKLERMLDSLLNQGKIIQGKFRESLDQEEIIDTENLEILLRMARHASRPEFSPLSPASLFPFLAQVQGLFPLGEEMKSTGHDLAGKLEILLGFSAEAGLWEEEILPARLSPYYSSWLDTLMVETELMWYGGKNRKLGFSFPEEMEIFSRSSGKNDKEGLKGLENGRYTMAEAASLLNVSMEKAGEYLWDAAWKGKVTNDSFAAVRFGMQRDCRIRPQAPVSSGRTKSTKRWRPSSRPPGNWYRIKRKPPKDAAEKAENLVLGVRQLFLRYGVLFRELTKKEASHLRWGEIFPVLRRMELSGEIYAGYFFEQISGPQFISKEGFRILQKAGKKNRIFWMNAMDPASLCGKGISCFRHLLPQANRGTHLAFQGEELVLVSKRHGKSLTFHCPPDSPCVKTCLLFFKNLLGRDVNPCTRIRVESINGLHVHKSPYAGKLLESGFVSGHNHLELFRYFE